MITRVRLPELEDNRYKLKEHDIDSIEINERAIIAIDGSTSNTGVAIVRESDGALFGLCSFTREKEKGETPVQYKVRLKNKLKGLLERNRDITKVYYEEPFVGYATAAPNLFMLRTFVEELIIENEPNLDYIEHKEVNNKRWKKLFLAPDKCPTGSEEEKAAVKAKMIAYLPFMADCSQDEIDAAALGFVACTSLKNGTSDDLVSTKIRPFKYNIEFIGADTDDDMCQEFHEAYTGPKKLLEESIGFSTIKATANFDKHVYKQMGSDDRVLVIKFSSQKHANLILEHRIGAIAAQYDYIYAIVWRKSRKTKA